MSDNPLPPVAERLRDILRLTAERVEDCPDCGKMQFFVRGSNDHLIPYGVDGLNHILYCPAKEPIA